MADPLMDGLCMVNEENSGRRAGRGWRKYDKTTVFKSKNLEAERKRRKKLKDKLMSLRALMNKAAIIDDAINYIKGLKEQVKGLSEQLQEIAVPCEEEIHKPRSDEDDTTGGIQKCDIKTDVKVTRVDENKLCIKITSEKKRGGFTKLMEAMSGLGFEVTDTSLTTSEGVSMSSFYVELPHTLTCDHITHIIVFFSSFSKERSHSKHN
uniref:BHLH domain-containing protein n=1 Tax=Nelumbo nucifera TaxID=4432 RepID=A0A822XW05_NELNU|nr:TPA_asm: hypothetical protein HUJ06_024649 [Nelumbo nucifera]